MPVGGFKGLGRENSNKKTCSDFAENQVYCKKIAKKLKKYFSVCKKVVSLQPQIKKKELFETLKSRCNSVGRVADL